MEEKIRKRRVKQLREDLKKRYGITLEDFNKMWNEQQGRCKICGVKLKRRDMEGSGVIYNIDHNHSLGVVRGILCVQCNKRLEAVESGWYEEYKEIVDKYLKEMTYIEDIWKKEKKVGIYIKLGSVS